MNISTGTTISSNVVLAAQASATTVVLSADSVSNPTFPPVSQLNETRSYRPDVALDNESRQREAFVEARVRSSLGRDDRGASSNEAKAQDIVEQRRLQEELEVISELSARDAEVRAHEQAHAAAAGPYGGAIRYEYQRGPDGVSYAVGGEVSIDTSPIPNDPEATLRKAEVIQRAATAPAEPSEQDRAVAALAAQMAAQARAEIAQRSFEESTGGGVDEVDAPSGLLETEEDSEVERETPTEAPANQAENTLGVIGTQPDVFEAAQQDLRDRMAQLNQRILLIGVLGSGNLPGQVLDTLV